MGLTETNNGTFHEDIKNYCLGRQPVFDSRMKLVGYEVLFRDSDDNRVSNKNETHITSQVLSNMLSAIGSKKVVGERLGFINFNQMMLIDGSFIILNPNQFVIELTDSDEYSDELLLCLGRFKELGYRLVLDHFDITSGGTDKYKSILPFADYVKIDTKKFKHDEIKKFATNFFKQSKASLFALRVESERQFSQLIELNFDLFQGYYFAKPEIIESQSINPKSKGIMDIVAQIQKGFDIDNVESSLRQNPEIVIQLLKFINSAGIGLKQSISSIKQAVMMLGEERLQKWLFVIMYAQNSNDGRSQSISNMLIQRARLMENIMMNNHKLKSEKAFLTGLLSQVDAVYKTPLHSILDGLALDRDIKNAILEKSGELGKVLSLALAFEQMDEQQIGFYLEELNLGLDQFNHSVFESYEWSNTLF
jgi:c-di-GMP-related signal transduction protein